MKVETLGMSLPTISPTLTKPIPPRTGTSHGKLKDFTYELTQNTPHPYLGRELLIENLGALGMSLRRISPNLGLLMDLFVSWTGVCRLSLYLPRIPSRLSVVMVKTHPTYISSTSFSHSNCVGLVNILVIINVFILNIYHG